MASLKVQLAAASKITLLVDVLKLNNQHNSANNANNNDETISGTESEGAENDTNISSSGIRLCISAAFFSGTTQKMEVILLGIRQPTCDSDLGYGIKRAIDLVRIRL